MSDDPGSSPASIEVAVPDGAWSACLPEVERLVVRSAARALRRGLAGKGLSIAETMDLELSFVLTDDAEVQGLNLAHRGQDKPTNVLSFPVLDEAALARAIAQADSAATGEPQPLLLGDVVLARQTIGKEAATQEKSLEDHLCHLVVHGVLHILGFDHEDEASAEVMERLEVDILSELNIADPYSPAMPEARDQGS